MTYLIWVLYLLIYLSTAATVINDYELGPGSSVYMRFGAYNKIDSPFGGNEDAYIDYDLSFKLDITPIPPGTNTLGEVVVFYYEQRNNIGWSDSGNSVIEKRNYCCTQEIKNKGNCNNLNRLIIGNSSDLGEIFYNHLELNNYNQTTKIGRLAQKYSLSQTGIWYILIANCDQDANKFSVTLSGSLIWKNPFGYLPGQILGTLPLYWIMALLYITLLGIWLRFTFKYRKDIMDLQHGIGVVILISTIECIIWAADYTNYNFTGQNSDAVNIIGALFTSAKLTVIRTLMLVVAIGYTITRPVMDMKYRVAIAVLSLIYFFLEAANQFFDVSIIAGLPVSELFQYAILTLLLLFNAIIFGWSGYEMYFTFVKLGSEGEKFAMYKRLGVLLLLSLILSVAILITQLIITALNQSDLYFRVWWLWEGYWEFIYAACIFFISWVWRPTENNLRFAYTEIGREDVEMDQSVVLDSMADKEGSPQEKKKEDSSISVSSDEEDNNNKKETTEPPVMTTNLDDEELSD